MLHPPIADLERYYTGRSSPEEVARVQHHLNVCSPCSVYLKETDIILEVLRQYAGQSIDDEAHTADLRA
jgi:hypothetical protein